MCWYDSRIRIHLCFQRPVCVIPKDFLSNLYLSHRDHKRVTRWMPGVLPAASAGTATLGFR